MGRLLGDCCGWLQNMCIAAAAIRATVRVVRALVRQKTMSVRTALSLVFRWQTSEQMGCSEHTNCHIQIWQRCAILCVGVWMRKNLEIRYAHYRTFVKEHGSRILRHSQENMRWETKKSQGGTGGTWGASVDAWCVKERESDKRCSHTTSMSAHIAKETMFCTKDPTYNHTRQFPLFCAGLTLKQQHSQWTAEGFSNLNDQQQFCPVEDGEGSG